MPQPELDLALQEAVAVIAQPDPATAAFQVRVGLAALDPVRDRTSPHAVHLQSAIADVAVLDAYAARDVLNHDTEGSCLVREQRKKLEAVLTAAGLGAGDLPPAYMQVLAEAVDKAEGVLRSLL
ncbi:hypothetical protein ACQUSR_27570 [Streptomyces sp. P1-3]|uniref:hypothetical protein n=1 Tax=Streptomyces sp. P1-3 TaxID=3421658 RepID=UPI003D362BDA